VNQIAIVPVDHRDHGGGFASKMRARAAGGGAALMRHKMRAAGEVIMASPARLSREIQAKSRVRYRLRHPDGAYVNLDLSGETTDRNYAWIGFLHQLEAVRSTRPDLADYRDVAVEPNRNLGMAVQVKLGPGRGVMG
jgi:hypothetical protein